MKTTTRTRFHIFPGITLHWGSKDGGPESRVYMYGLECKALFSILVLRFEDGSREAYHSHAFNAVSWILNDGAAMNTAASIGTCAECDMSYGIHAHTCSRYPKKGNRAPCHECTWYNGLHSASCQSRGYSAVGQHPDSPDRTPDTVRLPARGPCPCGIDRRDCEYHR